MSPPGARSKWQVASSSTARNTHNPIRSIVENLRLEPNPQKPMIALSIGDPTVFGNLKPPVEVIEAVQESLLSIRYNGYAPSTGYHEARSAVARYSSSHTVTVDPENVVLCSGCSCALDLCITVLANPGQNILVPRPGFSIYRTLAEGLGIRVKFYDLKPERSWEADTTHLQDQIDESTAAVVVNNPSNPCGSVYSREHLAAILEVARTKFVPIIADEIYEHMVFPGQTFHSLASLSEEVPILSCSGLTKRFLVPGWRMGWIIIHDRQGVFERAGVRSGLQRLSQRIIGSNTLIQGALPGILTRTPEKFYEDTVRTLQCHAEIAYKALSLVGGLTPVMPKGAMYMMVGINMTEFPEFQSELHFVEQMVTEESVFCLPSKCFDYPSYMRLVLTVPEEQLREACRRIAEFCRRHHRSENGSDNADRRRSSANEAGNCVDTLTSNNADTNVDTPTSNKDNTNADALNSRNAKAHVETWTSNKADTNVDTPTANIASTNVDILRSNIASTNMDTLRSNKASANVDTPISNKASTYVDTPTSNIGSTIVHTLRSNIASTNVDTLRSNIARTNVDTLRSNIASTNVDTPNSNKVSANVDSSTSNKASTYADTTTSNKANTNVDTPTSNKANTNVDTLRSNRARAKVDTPILNKASTNVDMFTLNKTSSNVDTFVSNEASINVETATSNTVSTNVDTCAANTLTTYCSTLKVP